MKPITVNLRLCSPALGSEAEPVNGMPEFFSPDHFKEGRMVVMICSPWLDSEPFDKLIELLREHQGNHELYLLTMRRQKEDIWDQAIAPRLRRLSAECDCFVQVRVLPSDRHRQENPAISGDSLHAKLFVLARKPWTEKPWTESILAAMTTKDLREAFFGSANFTGNGLHCDEHAGNHKWEVVSRAHDPESRREVFGIFEALWQQAQRVEQIDGTFRQDWKWPKNA